MGLKSCLSRGASPISTELNATYKRILGVPSTASNAVTAVELAMPPHHVLCSKQILRFFDTIRYGEERPRLVRQMIAYLARDTSSGIRSAFYDVRNGWKEMVALATKLGWSKPVLGSAAQKRQLDGLTAQVAYILSGERPPSDVAHRRRHVVRDGVGCGA